MSNNENNRKMSLGEIIFACVVVVTGFALAFLYITSAHTRDYILPSGLVILLVALAICRFIVKTDKQVRTLRNLAFASGTALYLITVSVISATLTYTAQWMIFLALCWVVCEFLTVKDNRDEHAENRYPYPQQQLSRSEDRPKPQQQSHAPQPQKPQPSVPKQMTEDEEAALLDDPQKFQKYVKHYELSLKTVFKMLRHPNGLTLLDIYLDDHELPLAAEFTLFQLPDPRPFVQVYFKHQSFQSQYSEAMMLDLPDPAGLVRDYYQNGHSLGYMAQRRILQLDDPDLLAAFTQNDWFCDDAVDDILALPDPFKFIKAHLHAGGDMSNLQIIRLLHFPIADNTPNELDPVTPLLENGNLDDEVVDAIFNSPRALKRIKCYLDSDGELSNQQIIRLLHLPIAEDTPDELDPATPLLEKGDLDEEVVDAIFNSPRSFKRIKIHLDSNGELSNQQIIRLLHLPIADDTPDELDPATPILKRWDLDDEVVDAIFDSPHALKRIKCYLDSDGELRNRHIIRLLHLPIADDTPDELDPATPILEKGNLNDEVVEEIFRSPRCTRRITTYLNSGEFDLDGEQEYRLFDLPNAMDLIEKVLENDGWLRGRAEMRVVTDMNLTSLLLRLLGDMMDEENEFLIFDRPDAQDLIIRRHQADVLSKDARALAQAKGWIPLD